MKLRTYPKLVNLIAIFLCGATIISACAVKPQKGTTQIQVVATTSILADVVSQIGGEYITVRPLVPVGSNEHEYQPAPRDIAAVSDADLVFEVGLGLEEFMSTIIQNAGSNVNVITVSDGILVKQFQNAGIETITDPHFSGDPHVWMDPANVIIWVRNISAALSDFDPGHKADYEKNSQEYISSLNELDALIQAEIEKIPADRRVIVTDHMLFGYFAEKYGLKVVGAVIPSYSSSAQASAQEQAALEDAIRKFDVKAILVGNTVNPALASQIAKDTGIELVPFYTGSLSAKDGPAGTYIDYMRYNMLAIVNALTR